MCENGILTFTTNTEFKEIETYLIKRSSKCLKGLFFIQNPDGLGGGSLNLELLKGGGLKQFWKSRWMGGEGGQKTVPSVMGVCIFSGITQWHSETIFWFCYFETKVTTRCRKLSLLWNPRAWDNMYMKQDFLAKKFLLPTLSTVRYFSRYLLFISYLTICFWIDWVHLYINTRKSRPRLERNYNIAREQKNVMSVTRDVIFIIAKNKPHTQYRTHLHTMKVYNTRPVSLTVCIIGRSFAHY